MSYQSSTARGPKSSRGVEIFYSYAHKDEKLRRELEKHLSILKQAGVITGWHDRDIGAGTEWEPQIDAHLNSANIILLLVSADFVASDYCYGIEMTRAMARHEAGEARVIPVILRPVDWELACFSKLQALPRDARPITTWPNRDEAFKDIAKGIRVAAEEIGRQKQVNPKASTGDTLHLSSNQRVQGTIDSPAHKVAALKRDKTDQQIDERQSMLADLNRAISLKPDDVWAYTARGDVSRRMGRYEEALADLNCAIKLQPCYQWALAKRGETYRQMRRYGQAMEDLSRAVQLRPDDDQALANRGCAYRHMGLYEKAMADLNGAIRLNPGNEWAIAERGVVHQLTGQDERALADLIRATRQHPASDEAATSLSATYHLYIDACAASMGGKDEQALGLLEQALEERPSLAMWARRDPNLRRLRGDARFEKIMKEAEGRGTAHAGHSAKAD